MNKTIKRTYLIPRCRCADIDNEELLCQTSFNTDEPKRKEMEGEDYAGVKVSLIFDNAFSD